MFILFTVLLLILNPAQYVATVGKDTYYCGFKQTCTSNMTVDDERRTDSCCLSCECTDVCEERGTCCADKENRNITDNVVKQQCIPAAAGRWAALYLRVQLYYARTRCPVTFTGSAIKDRCEKDRYKSVEDVIFVSSEDGSIVYKNKFCALCHGEKRILPWDVKIYIDACIGFLLKEDITEAYLNAILHTECELVFKRPDVVNLATLCFDTAINKCNDTGLWDNYDRDLESRCINPLETLYYYTTGLRVYKNLYCYLCNTGANVDPATCQLDNINKFPDESFVSLIGLRSEDRIRNEAKQSNVCKENQVLDTFFDTCKTLYCPKLSMPVNGQCIRYIDGIFSFCVTIRLIPQARLNTTISVQRELLSQYTDIIRQAGFRKCKICYAFMFLKISKDLELSEVYVLFSMTLSALCKAERIWAKVTEPEKASSYVDLYLNGTIIRLSVTLDNMDHENSKLLQMEEILYVGSRKHCKCVVLKRGSSCAKVKLTKEEYNSVLCHHRNAHELVFSPSNDGINGTMSVCIDKYIANTSGGNKLKVALLAVIEVLIAS